MMKLALSRATTALLRGLAARAGIDRDRMHLIEARSTDWQSLTFRGERHELSLRLAANAAEDTLARLTDGLAEAEFDLAGHLVIDVAIAADPRREDDGTIRLDLEALTIAAED